MSLFPISSYAATEPASAVANLPAANRSTTAPAQSPVASVATTFSSAVTQAPAVSDIGNTKSRQENVALDKAVAAINKFLEPIASSIEFSIDEESGRTLVKVIDTDTNDVLRQFPSKEALAISQQLDKLQGLLLKDKA